MKSLILAGGKGTRFSEETTTKPKPMIEILEKPMLLYIIEHYKSFGIDDFVIFSTSKKNILIGNNVTIGRSSHLNGSGGIIIKNNVILSTFVCIHSSNHQYRDRNKKKIYKFFEIKPLNQDLHCFFKIFKVA